MDLTTALTTIGIWGPNARGIVQSSTRADMSQRGVQFGTCRTVEIGSQLALASRICYVGDLGWELYVPMEQGRRLWDELWEAGQAVRRHGLRHRRLRHAPGASRRATARYGAELDNDYDPVEADMAPPDGQGAGLRRQGGGLERGHGRGRGAAAACTLTVDDHTARAPASGASCSAASRSSRRTAPPITDARGRRSYATSAGAGPSLGKHLLLATCRRSTRSRAPSSSSSTSASCTRSPWRVVGCPPAVRPRERAHPGLIG